MVRSSGARLAVLILAAAATIAALATGAKPAVADEGCVATETGLECTIEGTTVTVIVSTLPPYRYLRTTDMDGVGRCWYWSRYPPGLDSENPLHDGLIEIALALFSECPTTPGAVTVSVSTRAWEIFRSFTLAAPSPRLRPDVGIANLPTLATVSRPASLSHAELLPDGRTLEVAASVAVVRIDWGDGTVETRGAGTVFAGGAAHPYVLKTCAPEARPGEPPGGRCHPTLAAYPVRVTFVWTARYRTGGGWTTLGSIERSRTVLHDVDEVIGVQVGR